MVKEAKKTDHSVGQVQSLSRGLKLLEKISENKTGISLTDLALQVGLPNSTVHRLLTTMQQQGFIMQKGELGLWHVGVRAFTVGSAFFRSRDLMSICHPIMYDLMEDVEETVNLLVLNEDDWEAILIGQVQCDQLMRMVAPLGGSLPLHASGGGKVFLASFSDKEVSNIIKLKGLNRYTNYTIDTLDRLLDELKRIKLHGYANDLEEHIEGLHCVAAPVYDENKKIVAALSISGPKTRISNERLIHLGSIVIRYANKITEAYAGKFH